MAATVLVVALVVTTMVESCRVWFQRSALAGDRPLMAAVALASRRPLMLAIWGVAATLALEMLVTSPGGEAFSWAATMLVVIRVVVIAASMGWFVQRCVRAVERTLVEHGVDVTAVHALGNIIVVASWAVCGLVVLQSLGVNTAAILTVGGVSGVAVGIAAKDLITNVFGGLVVILTRPFAIGQRIELVGKNIEGTVDRIGLYYTNVRDDDGHDVIVPNALFLGVPVRQLDDDSSS